jgi:hypothetical protein
MNPMQDEYVHYVNESFVAFLEKQHDKLFLKEKEHRPWIGRIVDFVKVWSLVLPSLLPTPTPIFVFIYLY